MCPLKKKSQVLIGLADRFDLPEETISAQSKLSVTGRRQVLLENHQGSLEFGTERIVVRTIEGNLVFYGSGLKLIGMNRQELLLGGELQNVEWE